ncbi:BAHD family acyltransferase, clade V [Selaginella moellendorffii]|uniref:BAHD family acyltransferase, clade V n=1 Tax=Selaginella moellendorffii TaxID=88036 RepID=D8T6Q1_SELML|nr:omega-hydroxypalmitate O-feruloyl transferase [Selaginella moellendorffii]EFJ07679.1 BAHD family acyltransferase, clade V [Selaginella moellendorffii]|eukprot:XP_002991251.1 omega-hydroxypalmitate O-feruloyl transferase [Selaginella moellendorffii]
MAVAPVSDLQIEVGSSKIVAPAQAVEHSTLFLSNIDQEAMYKVESVYVFAANPERESDDPAEVIEAALAKTLVTYYFLAGRFAPNAKEGRLEVNCNGAGVLFAAATSKLRLSDLRDLSVPNPAFRSLLVQPSDSLGLFETPPATFQITRFKCGGFVFGMTIFHSLMDGVAITGFFDNLGSIARGGGVVMVPNPNREFLKARNPPQPQHYEQLMCRQFRVSSFSEIPLLPFNPTTSSVNNFAPEKHVFRSFPVSSQMISELKQACLKDETLSRCSSFEAITAHVLRQVARSRPSDPSALVSTFLAVDFSRKLQPPPPPNFCGNAVVAACVAATHQELCTYSLGHFARRVQEVLSDVDDEYVRSWTDFWELHRIGPARIPIGACLSAWWKLPFYALDFGWGTPIFAGPVPNQLVGFIVIVANGKNDGGANVYLGLEPQEMAAFEKNIYELAESPPLIHGAF